jgi:hypothetical protein
VGIAAGATMKPEHRKKLLAQKAKTERLIREAEALTVAVPDDEILLVTSKQLAELRQVFADVERKLNNPSDR